MKCKGKHVYDPPEDEWVCPFCGSTNDEENTFVLEESEYPECEKLHTDDLIVCVECEKEWSGEEISKLLKEREENPIFNVEMSKNEIKDLLEVLEGHMLDFPDAYQDGGEMEELYKRLSHTIDSDSND